MATSEKLLVEDGGKVTLPEPFRTRYGLKPDAPLRVIETRGGILLVPITDAPISETLRSELDDWQQLGAEGLAMFPFEEDRG